MHDNSILAYEQERPRLDARKLQVLSVVSQGEHEACTDRFVCEALGFQDMNKVRPRITELVKAGILIESGSVIDTLTRKKVRTVTVARRV